MQIMKCNHTVCSIGYHIIFCTKYRKPILTGTVEIDCKRIIGEICIQYNWKLRSLEIMPDHVHCFIQAKHTVSPGHIAQVIKSISAVHIFNKHPDLKSKKFWGTGLWSKSNYIGSVGHIDEKVVMHYINSQKSHSSTETSSRGIL